MSLSILTSRSENKFVYRGAPRRNRVSVFNRRNRRNQVIPALLEPELKHTESGKLDHSYHPSDPNSLDELCYRLRQNELRILKLGYHESNFLTHKRCGKKLEEALRYNTSVTTVSIGWRHSSREALLLVVRAVSRYTRLQHLQLILDDYLPENLVRSLLQNQSESLITIDIQSLHVRRRFMTGCLCCDQPEKPKATASWHDSLTACDHCVVSRAIVDLHTYLPRLNQLFLQDVGLNDKHAVMLADYLHIRGGVHVLSVRNNRQLGAHGAAVLCQAPIFERLDLSLCDMNPMTAEAIAPALAGRHSVLPELILSGNYRMGPRAIEALTGPIVRNIVQKLDLSYCDLTDSRSVSVLRSLQNSKLQHLCLSGCHVSNEMAIDALVQLLRSSGTRLRTLRLDDPHRPSGFSAPQLRQILAALRNNYELEELVVDAMCTNREWTQISKEMDFYLRLNKCGRRILLCRDETATRSKLTNTKKKASSPEKLDLEWIQVLETTQAQDDFDMLYWMVRHSADRF